MKEAFIDRVFRGYGEEAFGKTRMDTISSLEVEGARCAAMQVLAARTIRYGKQEQGTAKGLFCKYISEKLAVKEGTTSQANWWDFI